jgi:excisionase family DNA binding protein
MRHTELSLRRQPDTHATPPGALPQRFLTPDNVADLLGVPIETLYQWRRKGTGPPAFRVGKHLRYEPAEVRRWVDSLAEGVA